MSDASGLAIECTVDGAVATVRLASGRRGNALGPADMGRIADTIGAVGADAAVRAVVLTGSHGVFSAGAALDALDGADIGAMSTVVAAQTSRLAHAMLECPVVVIAAVDGAAAGGAAGIALMADLLVMSSSGRLLFPFAKLGLVPDSGITAALPRAIGMSRATALLMQGGEIDAARALQLGLALAVHPPEAMEAEVTALARAMGDVPRGIHRDIRRLLRPDGHDNALAREADMQARRLAEPETRAAIARALRMLKTKSKQS